VVRGAAPGITDSFGILDHLSKTMRIAAFIVLVLSLSARAQLIAPNVACGASTNQMIPVSEMHAMDPVTRSRPAAPRPSTPHQHPQVAVTTNNDRVAAIQVRYVAVPRSWAFACVATYIPAASIPIRTRVNFQLGALVAARFSSVRGCGRIPLNPATAYQIQARVTIGATASPWSTALQCVTL
jgi:hypothetical protein